MPRLTELGWFSLFAVAAAQCHGNSVQNATGECIPCGLWEFPLDGACVKYSSRDEKIAADQVAEVDTGNTAWMLVASAMVMLMTPGLALFYGGLSGHEYVLNTMTMSVISMCVVTISWVLFGYSFAFGPGNGDGGFGYGGWAALKNVGKLPSAVYGTNIPHAVFVAFQCMFAQITPAVISGAIVGRMTFLSYIIFIFFWSLVIYNCLSYWVWAMTLDDEGKLVPLGWLGKLGLIDFAGGTVIEIASGFSGLAASIAVGPRMRRDSEPCDTPMVLLGASLLWFGWLAFNAGSAGAANGVAAIAFLNTHISPCACVITWLTIETLHKKKQTLIAASTAMVVGQVCITPAAGFVTPMAAIAFGIVPAFFCYAATEIKVHYVEHRIDDTLDVFACHGVAGVVGTFMTGLFATSGINGVDGAFYGRPILLGYQTLGIVVAASFSFFGSLFICLILKYTIGLRNHDLEERGLDDVHTVASDCSPRHSFGSPRHSFGEKSPRPSFYDESDVKKSPTQDIPTESV